MLTRHRIGVAVDLRRMRRLGFGDVEAELLAVGDELVAPAGLHRGDQLARLPGVTGVARGEEAQRRALDAHRARRALRDDLVVRAGLVRGNDLVVAR